MTAVCHPAGQSLSSSAAMNGGADWSSSKPVVLLTASRTRQPSNARRLRRNISINVLWCTSTGRSAKALPGIAAPLVSVFLLLGGAHHRSASDRPEAPVLRDRSGPGRGPSRLHLLLTKLSLRTRRSDSLSPNERTWLMSGRERADQYGQRLANVRLHPWRITRRSGWLPPQP